MHLVKLATQIVMDHTPLPGELSFAHDSKERRTLVTDGLGEDGVPALLLEVILTLGVNYRSRRIIHDRLITYGSEHKEEPTTIEAEEKAGVVIGMNGIGVFA